MRLAPALIAALLSLVSAGEIRAADIVCATTNTGPDAPFCIDSSGFVALDGRNKPPVTYIRHIATCGQRFVVANSSEVAFRDGNGAWVTTPRHGKLLTQALGCSAKGAIFVAHKDGIVRFEGGQWTDTPYTALNVANGLLDGVKRFVTKPDGSLWAVLGKTVGRYDGTDWKPLAEPPPLPSEAARFIDGAAGRDGRLWLLHSAGIAIQDGPSWTISKESLSIPTSIAIDAKGVAWVAVNDGIRVFSGGTWKKELIGGMEPQLRIRSMAFDGKGRLWLTSTWGIGVIESNVARFWRLSNSDIPFDDLSGLIVDGNGPASLPTMQDRPTGGIKGKLEGDDNAGIADVKIEFCNAKLGRFSSFRAGGTPCSAQAPLTFNTRTYKDGSFNVDKIPPGDYSMVVEREAGKWVLITGSIGVSAESVRVASGKVSTVPTITLKAK